MAHISKFPFGGFEFVVYDRDDILNTIKQNIVDPEVLKDIIENLEDNVYNHVINGDYTSYPYIGTIKPKTFLKQLIRKENKETFKEAKEVLSNKQFYVFRLTSYKNLKNSINANKYYASAVKYAIKHNKTYYKYLLDKTNNETYARLMTYFILNITPSICDYFMSNESR